MKFIDQIYAFLINLHQQTCNPRAKWFYFGNTSSIENTSSSIENTSSSSIGNESVIGRTGIKCYIARSGLGKSPYKEFAVSKAIRERLPGFVKAKLTSSNKLVNQEVGAEVVVNQEVDVEEVVNQLCKERFVLPKEIKVPRNNSSVPQDNSISSQNNSFYTTYMLEDYLKRVPNFRAVAEEGEKPKIVYDKVYLSCLEKLEDKGGDMYEVMKEVYGRGI